MNPQIANLLNLAGVTTYSTIENGCVAEIEVTGIDEEKLVLLQEAIDFCVPHPFRVVVRLARSKSNG